ncbi:MAG TPA: phosphoglycerate mutase family protein [Roseateles sp.]
MTKCIMLIRHAEKPRAGAQGVDGSGRHDEQALSVAGWKRAGALVPYFAAPAGAIHGYPLCRPHHIYAARRTARHPSTRPRDTVQELADFLSITVDERWSDSDPVQHIALHLKSHDQPVLVSWRHDVLPMLGRAIAGDAAVPARWPDDRFDLTWVFRPGAGGWQLLQLPQRLLAGDRNEVLCCD